MNKRRNFLLGFLAAISGIGLYQFRSRIVAQLLKLPPPRHKIRVEHNILIPMRDGVILRADHYAPRTDRSFPTILVRTIYGRGSNISLLGVGLNLPYARFAERGYHVIVQTTRGQFDSGGEFRPGFHETEDGLDTIAWIEDQPWFNGNLGMWGPSYLSHTQWAVAAKAPTSLKAIMPAVISSNIYELFYTDEVLNIEIGLRWMMILAGLRAISPRGKRKNLRLLNPIRQNRLIKKAVQSPLRQSDKIVVGETVPHFQESLNHPSPDAPYWRSIQFRASLTKVIASTYLVSGWYDMSLGGLLQDYSTLRASGHKPFLTIGPWHHLDLSYANETLREGLDWFESRLKGNHHNLRKKAVRIFLMNADEWYEMDNWPPPSTPTPYYLHPHGELGRSPAGGEHAPSTFSFDPMNPTPVSGGARLSQDGGRRDQRSVESRPDVITFTSPPLVQDMDVIGPVRAVLFVRSSLQNTDFIARLCEVSNKGQSTNVCDGIFRISPGKGELQSDETIKIEIDLWATANRFRKGHCIRLQIASAGVPRWVINSGEGESQNTKGFLSAQQEIFHDETHPAMILLPIL